MIIAIDFDGTLHDGEWPNIGQPAWCAADVMRKLKADGHYLIIWTCREGKQLAEAVNWLLEQDMPFDRVNDNEPSSTAFFGNNSRKVNADLYVDDKQVGGLPPWEDICDYVERLDKEQKKL